MEMSDYDYDCLEIAPCEFDGMIQTEEGVFYI